MDSDRPAQLVGSSGAALPSFETIMARYVSESSVQNEEARRVYDQWKEDNPDSLFMELVGAIRELKVAFICLYDLKLCETQPLDWETPYKWKYRNPHSKILQPVREVSEDDVIRARLNCFEIAHMLPSEILSKWGVMAPETRCLVVSILLECIEMEVPCWHIFVSLCLTFIRIKSHPESSFDDLNIDNRVESVLLKMAATITNLLNEGDELSCGLRVSLLESFFDAWPAGMNHGQLLGFMLNVVMNETFGMKTRHLAIEYLLCLAEAQHDMPPKIWEELLQVLMHKLLDINDDGVPGEFFDIGEFGLGRLASALDGHMIFDYMYGLVIEYLDDAHDWKKRFSGLKCIAQMAYGCSEVLVNDRLESIFSLVLNAFVDPNACVQRAAFDSVRFLANSLSPNFQNLNAGRVLEGLLAVIMASHDPQLKADAVQAMRDFFATCNEDIIERYHNEMADKLRYFHVIL